MGYQVRRPTNTHTLTVPTNVIKDILNHVGFKGPDDAIDNQKALTGKMHGHIFIKATAHPGHMLDLD